MTFPFSGYVAGARLLGVEGNTSSAAFSAISTARRQTSRAFLASPVLFAILVAQRRIASFSTIWAGTSFNRDSMIWINCAAVYGSKLTRVSPEIRYFDDAKGGQFV